MLHLRSLSIMVNLVELAHITTSLTVMTLTNPKKSQESKPQSSMTNAMSSKSASSLDNNYFAKWDTKMIGSRGTLVE